MPKTADFRHFVLVMWGGDQEGLSLPTERLSLCPPCTDPTPSKQPIWIRRYYIRLWLLHLVILHLCYNYGFNPNVNTSDGFCFVLRGEWGSVYLNSWNIVYSNLYLEENLFFSPGFSTIKKSPMYSLCLLSRVIVCRDQRCRHLGVKLYHAGSGSDSTAPKYTNLTIHAIVSCVYQQQGLWKRSAAHQLISIL